MRTKAIIAAAIVVAFLAGMAVPRPYIAALDGEPAAFDHSGCQYPDRTTNPVDGCDNSDPCDPAQTKGGSGDCLPTDKDPVNDLPDPDRNYFDGQGNEYRYDGTPVTPACKQ